MPESGVTRCRTPAAGRDGVVDVPTWKYQAVRRAILHAVEAAGAQGMLFSQLSAAVRARLSSDQLTRLGSVGWHTTTVKLNMEVEGELRRVPGASPQRLVPGSAAPEKGL